MPLEPHMWQFPKNLDRSWKIKSRVFISTVGIFSKFVVALNNFKVVNKGALTKFIAERKNNQGLVTVTNHHSCLDDPILWGILNWNFVFGKLGSKIRWTLTADNVCFKQKWHAKLFCLFKSIPVVRGDGVFQRGVDYGIEKLNAGEWINIFPEAMVNLDNTFIRYKWGVGRMIAEAEKAPIVLPFYHLGMDSLSPNKGFLKYYPRIGKKVTVVVGEEINLSHILKLKEKLSSEELRKRITDVIQDEMLQLKARTEKIHFDRNTV